MRTEKHTLTTATTASEIINGAYILFSIQQNNILISHQIIFTSIEEEKLCKDVPEALHLLTTSPVPPNYLEQMINPGSRFTFVARHLSKDSVESFRHFLDLAKSEDCMPTDA
jgi:hypothetical protein